MNDILRVHVHVLLFYLPDSVECLAQFSNLERVIDGTNACMSVSTAKISHTQWHIHTLTIFGRVLILIQISSQYGVVHDIDVGWHGMV